MKSRIVVIIMLATLALHGPAVQAFAANPSPGQEPAGAPPVFKMMMTNLARLIVLKSELGITNEQRAKIKSALRAHGEEVRVAAKSIVEHKRALREAVLNQNETDIKKASAELGTAITNAALLASKVVSQVRPTLTPEQIDKITKFRTATDKERDLWLDQLGK